MTSRRRLVTFSSWFFGKENVGFEPAFPSACKRWDSNPQQQGFEPSPSSVATLALASVLAGLEAASYPQLNEGVLPLNLQHNRLPGENRTHTLWDTTTRSTIELQVAYCGLTTRDAQKTIRLSKNFGGAVRIRTPDFRPYRFSRPVLEPVQLTTPNFLPRIGWDSNPRTTSVTDFPDPLLKPLEHLSKLPRRVRDSNSRTPFRVSRFQIGRLRPLSQPSSYRSRRLVSIYQAARLRERFSA